jgi:hypothetical protein
VLIHLNLEIEGEDSRHVKPVMYRYTPQGVRRIRVNSEELRPEFQKKFDFGHHCGIRRTSP